MSRYIVSTKVKNIDLIPTGPTPPNPIELLSSRSNGELIDTLRKHYDIIILDSPPVLGISDTSVLLKYSDANLVVVSSGKTQYELLERCKKAFETANSKITGVVINKENKLLNIKFMTISEFMSEFFFSYQVKVYPYIMDKFGN